MSRRPPLPPALRRALEAESGPVDPLPRVAFRVSWLLAWLCGAVALVVTVVGLRSDMAALGVGLSWVAAAAECGFGLALVALAVREAVPGSGVALPKGLAAIAAGAAAHAVIVLLTWLKRGMPPGTFPPAGLACMSYESALGVAALAIVLLLVARAYAVRPRWAGLLGGAGAGLLADGVWHLACPFADLQHVLVTHTGSIALLAALGWAAGLLAERVRIARSAGR